MEQDKILLLYDSGLILSIPVCPFCYLTKGLAVLKSDTNVWFASEAGGF